MADLSDYQFELDGVQFGIGHQIALDESGFQPGGTEWSNQDEKVEGTDSVRFGRDRATGGPTWGFSMHTDTTYTPEDALAARDALKAVWQDDEVRLNPRAVQWLRYRVGRRVRRVAGRPRAWASPPSNLLIGGLLPIAADFKLAAPMYFDDAELTTEISLQAKGSNGGWYFPLEWPLTTDNDDETSLAPGVVEPAGDMPAPFRATIYGPGVDMGIYTADWEIKTVGTLAVGETIEISTYPWDMHVLRNGVKGIPLSRATRLSRARLSHRGDLVRLTGSTSASDSRALVRWHPTNKDW